MKQYRIDATGGRILVVEDDPDTQRLLAECLPSEYRVVTTMTGEDAVFACRQVRFDLAIVDVRLPDTTGIDLIPCMQQIDPGLPIILMTAFPNPQDAFSAAKTTTVVGYLDKPFSVHELQQRVKTALAATDDEHHLRLNDLTIDCAARQVWRDGQPLPLTRQEVDVMIYIARAGRDGQIVRYEDLIQAVWSYDPSLADIGLVRVTVGRLRQKLNDDPRSPRYIETVRGVGYRVVPAD